MNKNTPPWLLTASLGFLLSAVPLAASQPAYAKGDVLTSVQKNTEAQVRRLVEPLLDKYCQESCKLLSVTTTVDVATNEQVAPGFDEIEGAAKGGDLAASSARIKLLIDDKVGPVSRQKLVDLIHQFLETLDFPVKIDTTLAHFPQPVGSESRVVELRDKVIKQFRNTMDELFNQFCPEQCMLADFNVETETVNPEEASYGKPGEFIQDGGVALRVKEISATILMDDLLTPEERKNVLEMSKLKTNIFKNVELSAKAMRFPHPDYMTSARGLARNGGNGNGRSPAGESNELNKNQTSKSDSQSLENRTSNSNNSSNSSNESKDSRTSNSNNSNSSNSTNKNSENNSSNSNSNNSSKNIEDSQKHEKYERFEKLERVESGDAVQAELQKFKVYGLVLACAIISLLVFVAMASMRPRKGEEHLSPFARVINQIAGDPSGSPSFAGSGPSGGGGGSDENRGRVAVRYEVERLTEELMNVFAQQPRVAKQVFSRVLTEEGVETTSRYIQMFGESVVMDMLRDPSLQSDLNELMEYYAKNPVEMKDEEKLELLRKLHNRTVAGKLFVMGNRSSNLFDFLAEMDGLQILELIRTESLTVKSIVMTQVDPQKRAAIYSQIDEDVRMKLLTELSRIDYLPRDYIFNVANALKRKRKDNPRLNTEALPGSEVLVTLLERTGVGVQHSVVKNLELTNPESARTVKSKLVSLDTLRYLRDGQLLEVVLSLRHDELLQFLKGSPDEVKASVFAKSPKELIVELEEELVVLGPVSRETYIGVERKVLNRMKMMANEGLINLIETNERMFADGGTSEVAAGYLTAQAGDPATATNVANIKKVAGW